MDKFRRVRDAIGRRLGFLSVGSGNGAGEATVLQAGYARRLAAICAFMLARNNVYAALCSYVYQWRKCDGNNWSHYFSSGVSTEGNEGQRSLATAFARGGCGGHLKLAVGSGTSGTGGQMPAASQQNSHRKWRAHPRWRGHAVQRWCDCTKLLMLGRWVQWKTYFSSGVLLEATAQAFMRRRIQPGQRRGSQAHCWERNEPKWPFNLCAGTSLTSTGGNCMKLSAARRQAGHHASTHFQRRIYWHNWSPRLAQALPAMVIVVVYL